MKASIYFIMVLFSTLLPLMADGRSHIFKRFSIDQRLTHYNVTSIAEDKFGSYWVGTGSGLNRIIGDDIVNYSHIPTDSTSTINNVITQIAIDSKDNIWVNTANGVALYNVNRDNFESYSVEGEPIDLFCVTRQHVLFYAGKKLYLHTDDGDELIPTHDSRQIRDILAIDETNFLLYLNSSTTLLLLNIETRSVKELTYSSPIDGYWSICSVKIDSKDNIWIAYGVKGLLKCRIEGENLNIVHHYNSSNSELSNHSILDVVEHEDDIWIATDGGGILILDAETDQISKLEVNNQNDISAYLNATQKLFVDSNNIVVMGTVRGGVIYAKEVEAKSYKFSDNNFGVSNQTISSIFESEDGSIWIGTDGGGLNKYSPQSKQFTKYKSTANAKIGSIAMLNSEELLLSLYGGGLKAFHMQSGDLRDIPFADTDLGKQIKNGLHNITLAKNEAQRIAITGGVNCLYNPKINKLIQLRMDSGVSRPSQLRFMQSANSIIYRFFNNKIYKIGNGILSLVHQVDYPIFSAAIDMDGVIWYADKKGLNRVELLTGTTELILTLPYNTIIDNILLTDPNQLWLGTSIGIYCYDTTTNLTQYIGNSKGVVSNRYRSSLISKDGNTIYFGGVEGLSVIDVKEVVPNFKSVQATVAQILVDKKNIAANEDIEVRWDFSSIDILLKIDNRDIFSNMQTTFIVEGDQNTNKIHTHNSQLSINSLPSGRYTIKASAIDNNGLLCEPITILKLTVAAPWWKSWWIYIVWSAIVITIVALILTTVFLRKRQKWEQRINEGRKKLLDDKVMFLINISHELRTPLTLAYSPIKNLLKNTDNTPETQSMLQRVFKQMENMYHLINLGLDARKIEVGGGELNLEKSDFNTWLKSICLEFDDEYKAKKIDMQLDLDKQVTPIYFDHNSCRIILSNLLMNALKYSVNNSTVTVKTELLESQKRVCISVIDQGVGIHEADLSNIFDRFYQGNSKSEGYGIGLSYTKNLVEMHEGSIGARNNSDVGATFYFELPTTLQRDFLNSNLPRSIEESIYLIDTEDGNGLNINKITAQSTILFVDDNIEIQEMIHSTFVSLFKNVLIANDGVEALEIIRKERPSIVVSDVMMPKMDGFALCKTIKTDIEISHIPCILLTARADNQSTAFGYKIGADSYIPKPFDTDFLYTVICNLLRSRENIKHRFESLDTEVSPETVAFSRADEMFMNKLNDFIDDNISNDRLDLKMITCHMNMGRTTFINKIKEITGVNAVTYINRIRIERAKELIKDGRYNITEVSEMVGFASSTYFSSTFKNYTQITPSEYKIQINKKI